MKIQPFGERITVRVIAQEETTEGGLIVAVSKEKSNKGIVEAIGGDVKDYIKVGDAVVFNLGAGTSYSDGTTDYKVLNIRDVLGKIVEWSIVGYIICFYIFAV